jgi:hypothetical protein
LVFEFERCIKYSPNGKLTNGNSDVGRCVTLT